MDSRNGTTRKKRINMKYIFVALLLTGCTLSFQNVDTHGAATDLIDENQTSQPNISPDASVSIIPKT